MSAFLSRLEKAHPGKIRRVFKHFPLSYHEKTIPAASAAMAAHAQGKFWEMADLLFNVHGEVGPSEFLAAAESLDLPADDAGVLLLRRVRDEAHRFAVGYHRTKRSAKVTGSILDQLPGVGERRKQAILQHFGSPERFLRATREEVEAVPGLPGKVAREVHAFVHKTG